MPSKYLIFQHNCFLSNCLGSVAPVPSLSCTPQQEEREKLKGATLWCTLCWRFQYDTFRYLDTFSVFRRVDCQRFRKFLSQIYVDVSPWSSSNGDSLLQETLRHELRHAISWMQRAQPGCVTFHNRKRSDALLMWCQASTCKNHLCVTRQTLVSKTTKQISMPNTEAVCFLFLHHILFHQMVGRCGAFHYRLPLCHNMHVYRPGQIGVAWLCHTSWFESVRFQLNNWLHQALEKQSLYRFALHCRSNHGARKSNGVCQVVDHPKACC